jgi:hypothetical protein
VRISWVTGSYYDVEIRGVLCENRGNSSSPPRRNAIDPTANRHFVLHFTLREMQGGRVLSDTLYEMSDAVINLKGSIETRVYST